MIICGIALMALGNGALANFDYVERDIPVFSAPTAMATQTVTVFTYYRGEGVLVDGVRITDLSTDRFTEQTRVNPAVFRLIPGRYRVEALGGVHAVKEITLEAGRALQIKLEVRTLADEVSDILG